MLRFDKAPQAMKCLGKNIAIILLKRRNAMYFVKKGQQYRENGNIQMAERFLRLGLNVHPENKKIHKEFALYLSEKKLWKKSVSHWEKVYKEKTTNLSPKSYLQYAKALQKIKQVDKSIEVLRFGLTKHPTNEQIILALTNLFMRKKMWKQASDVLITLFEIEGIQIPVEAFRDLTDIYAEQRLFDRAEYIVRQGMELFPEAESLINSYVNLAIYQRNWDLAVERIEHLLSIHEGKLPMDSMIKLSMLYQMKGDVHLAEEIFIEVLKKHKQEIANDKKGYRKITLFDNGESRIDFYKNLKKVKQVVVTFDTLYMTWDELPFGFHFLLRQNADIIAVRKRQNEESQQYLTQEEFVDTVQSLVNGYEDKVAYGHSLGGYTALYYASKVNCRILSLSPRLSLHPIYGKKGVAPKQEFLHNITHDYNDQIAPVIVYDPIDKLDSTYVHNELLVAYPNAHLVKIHYGGHGMARHLLRMGSLKDFVLAVLDGKVPIYDRRLKSKSANYYRLLGRECLRRDKLNWAWNLSERAVQLLPRDRYVIKFRVDVLRRLNKIDEAIAYAKECVNNYPKNIHIRLILIDLYMEKRELIYAKREVKAAMLKFKNTAELTKRMEEIDGLWV